MANLSITSRCNRHCDYCFARAALDEYGREQAAMSSKVFNRALNFLMRSGVKEVRLLGGEPTLHPHFLEFVDRIIGNGLRVSVFTGGLINRKILERLALIGRDKLSVLMNVIALSDTNESELRRQMQVLQRLGDRVVLGMNIPSPGIDLGFLLDLIDQHGLRRHVRLGLAHPTVGGQNQYLHPRDYQAVGRRAYEFGLEALSRNVVIDWDCGWVPCMFPSDAFQEAGLLPEGIGLRCNPIPDVLMDGRVIACYPLAALSDEPLPDNEDAAWLRARLGARLAGNNEFFLYKQCSECQWRISSACSGGCKAAALLRVRNAQMFIPAVRSQSGVNPGQNPKASSSNLGGGK